MLPVIHCPGSGLCPTMKISLGKTDADRGTVRVTTPMHVSTHCHVNDIAALIKAIRAILAEMAD